MAELPKVGVAFIDDEHDALLGLIARLDPALRAAAPQAEIESIAAQLSRLAETHFWHEEAQFMGTDFPRAAQHARHHRHLKIILASTLRSLDRSGRNIAFTAQLGFLRDWLMDHILNEDQPLAAYLNAEEQADDQPQKAACGG